MSTATAYPMGSDYVEALYNTKVCFKDPALAGGEVILNLQGIPKAISGNFASVFTVDGTDDRRWAVKCFTRRVPDQSLRYQAISQALSDVHSPWRVDFQYLPEGILCKGQWYPAVKMEWIEATSLIPYLERNLGDAAALAQLAEKFVSLVGDLARHGIGHGDLQHGNLLVTPSGDLKLIDYDGMFVPGLAALGPSEAGLPNYQSPLRSNKSWGPDVDRFSSWVISASLAALTLDSSLWAVLHRDGEEALLFKKADFLDRDNSPARTALLSSENPKLWAIVGDIDFLWSGDLRDVPPLTSPSDHPATPVPASGAAGSGLPEWMRDVSVAPAESSAPSIGAGWISTHLPSAPTAELTPPSRRARTATGALLASALALCAATAVSPALAEAAEAAGALLTLGTALGISAIPYRSLPTVKEMRRATAVAATRRATVRDALAEVHAQATLVQKLERQRLQEQAKAEQKAAKAHAEERSDLDAIAKRTGRTVEAIGKRLAQLGIQESHEMQRALGPLQREHIERTMRHSTIAAAHIYGIGPSLAGRLAAHGIHSAADVRAARSLTFVPGIGEKKHADLQAWANRVEIHARANAPSALPTAQATTIRLKYRGLQDDLTAKRSLTEADSIKASAEARDRWAAVHASTDGELAALAAHFSQQRQERETALARARSAAGTADWHLESAKRELHRYRNVRYRKYLKRLVTG